MNTTRCSCGATYITKDHGSWIGYYCKKCQSGGSHPKKGGGSTYAPRFNPQVYKPKPKPAVNCKPTMMNSREQFFKNEQEIALFHAPSNQLSYEDDKFFCSIIDTTDYGFKAVEVFLNDIEQNLVFYAFTGNSIYRTEKFWYAFTLNTQQQVIETTCFDSAKNKRWDTWMNISAVNVGGDFLAKFPEKKVVTCERI